MNISAKHLLFAAGPLTIPILMCSISALAIMIQKWGQLKNMKKDFSDMRSRILTSVRENKIKNALSLCSDGSSAAANVFRAGLLKFGSHRADIKEAVNDAISFEIPRLEQGLVPLATIANIAPLFGLLGTVLGLSQVFHEIQTQSSLMHAITVADLAGGVWQAFSSTIAGLCIAIPSFVVYNYFLIEVNSRINDLNRAGQDLTELMTRINEADNGVLNDIRE